MKRTTRQIIDSINAIRTSLGMDVRSYPGTSRTAVLVIETRYKTLQRDFANDSKADNILSMDTSDLARIYQIDEFSASQFFAKFRISNPKL